MARTGPMLGLVICLCLRSVAAISSDDQAFIITGSQRSENILRRQIRSLRSTITGMHVTSVIRSRFAKVTTVSKMENTHTEAKEMTFSVRLPDAAFITEFTMLVDETTFVGKVKEKAEAEREYNRAKARGNSAGLIAAKVRETKTFSVAANVPAHSNVVFTFVYQELLKRKLGKYNHDIYVNPNQIVDDFVVTVYITEQTGITMLAAKTPVDSRLPKKDNVETIETHIRRSKYQAKLTFKPTLTQQSRLLEIPEDDRKMTVVYDVTRENLGGEIQTRDGYFVHFFAPQDLPVLPKKIVFVIDRSGSMLGQKMKQTKIAFETVLNDMSDADQFNIVDFSDDAQAWKPELVSVTETNVQEAIAYVKRIDASGGTNLNEALLLGAKLLKHVKPEDAVSAAIFALTDGDPTTGVIHVDSIRSNVKKAVGGKFSVFCLGFGNHLNHDFLKRMANENDGITRKIYEDSDADLQLEGFFREVATPLLLKVNMTYSGSKTSDVSKINFEKYFAGSEVIVVGTMLDPDKPLMSRVVGTSVDGKVGYDVVSKEVEENFRHWYEDTGDFNDFIERLWAYYTITKLLEKKDLVGSEAEAKSIMTRARDLALKYKFVTSVTSMVVVLPEDEITPSPSTSKNISTVPSCYEHGSSVPRGVVNVLWCPYIFEKHEDEQLRQSSMRKLIARTQSLSRSIPRNSGRKRMSLSQSIPRNSGMSLFRAVAHSRKSKSRSSRKRNSLFRVVAHSKKSKSNRFQSSPSRRRSKKGRTRAKKRNRRPDKPSLSRNRTTTTQPAVTTVTSSSTSEIITPDMDSPNCGREVTLEDGYPGKVTSPNYPAQYASNAKCVWTFINDNNATHDLRLKIMDMDIEINGDNQCEHDKIVFMDGEKETEHLCGTEAGKVFISSQREIKLAFFSDDGLEAGGFSAEYELVLK